MSEQADVKDNAKVKTLGELSFDELKLDDPRYIEWRNKVDTKWGRTMDVMNPALAATTLNLTMWQYQSMFGVNTVKYLINKCIQHHRMKLIEDMGIPDVYSYVGKKFHVNFDLTREDVMAFKPVFTEVPY